MVAFLQEIGGSMKKIFLGLLFSMILIFTSACTSNIEVDPISPVEAPTYDRPVEPEGVPSENNEAETEKDVMLLEKPMEEIKELLEEQYSKRDPLDFGENIEGVKTSIVTSDKVVALTFDACGGTHGSGYDEALIEYLIKEKVPVTLFINSRWIEANEEQFLFLASNPLFQMENHGTKHRPLCINGQSIYGIKGTEGISEVVEEVVVNHRLIEEMTGRAPKYFRSGTAYYDDVSVMILDELQLKAVNFDVLGDAGATFTKEQMLKSSYNAKEGSIFLFHMNQPHSEVSQGIPLVVENLRRRGFEFVQLETYDTLLK